MDVNRRISSYDGCYSTTTLEECDISCGVSEHSTPFETKRDGQR